MKKNNKIALFVCAHKEDSCTRTTGCYIPVQAGKAIHKDINLGFFADDTGENISEKNNCYSELTVLYWAWKNWHTSEIMGLCHYRRYFQIEVSEIEKTIKKFDMITVKAGFMASKRERARNLMLMTSQEDFYIFADTFLSMHPEYEAAFIEYFYNSRKSYPFQMFIATKEIFDDYCDFLFPVLFEIEKKTKAHGYTRQNRTMGYIGEWMLGLYIYCKKLKVKQVKLDKSDEDMKLDSGIKKRIVRFMRMCVYKILDLLYPVNSITPSAGVRNGLKMDGIHLNKI